MKQMNFCSWNDNISTLSKNSNCRNTNIIYLILEAIITLQLKKIYSYLKNAWK